jgi:SAM-dependent methyltransferase
MKFKLPVWNGVKNFYGNQKINNLEIKTSSIKGVFIRKDNNFVDYQKDYTHMTPLKCKGYINNIRSNKTNFIKENIKLVGSCLEIGGGDDFNIRNLKYKKFTICDPHIKTYKKNKIEFIRDFYENINFKEKFDTIIMHSVLEHTKNLYKFLKQTKKILKKNGNFFLEIPVIDNQFLNGDLNCLVHEHENYFSKKGIFNLMKNFNFEIKTFYFKNDAGFFYIKHANKKKNYILESSLINLNECSNFFKKKILNFVNFLKKNKNRRIIFYGCNNGLNTLLYFFQKKFKIKKNKIFIVDSDSNKWGKYIPSYRYPVQKPSIIKKSDLVCVSSLSFYDEIVQKLKKNNQICSLNDI